MVYHLPARNAPEDEHAILAERTVRPAFFFCDLFGGTHVEIKLKLETDRDPLNIKGLTGAVGVITDADNNLICLVPDSKIDWVHECLQARIKTDDLWEKLQAIAAGSACIACRREMTSMWAANNDCGTTNVCRFDRTRVRVAKATSI